MRANQVPRGSSFILVEHFERVRYLATEAIPVFERRDNDGETAASIAVVRHDGRIGEIAGIKEVVVLAN